MSHLRNPNLRKFGYLTIKLAISTGILYFIFNKIAIQNIFSRVALLDIKWGFFGLILISTQLIFNSFRWLIISKIQSLNFSLSNSLRYVFIGHFFNQILPSSIGGDAIRIWLISKDKNSIQKSTSSIFCDRITGLIISIMLPFFLSYLPFDSSQKISIWLTIPGYFVLIGLIVFYLFGKKIAHKLKNILMVSKLSLLILDSHKIFFLSSQKTVAIFFLSLLIQVLNVFAIYSIARGLKIEIDLRELFLLVPIIFIAPVLPISIAGWGVRESSMIIGLGLIGIATSDSLTISIIYGILQILNASIGWYLWLLLKFKH
jgi:uncharacterized protein (TIRG00374 family)